MLSFEMNVEVFDDVLISDLKESKVLIGAIDQGTSSTRLLVFSKGGRIAASAQMEHTQIFMPGHAGWHEHDPLEIWNNTKACIAAVFKILQEKGFSVSSTSDGDAKALSLAAIGITNQRETTIAWNKVTGKPYHNAIVWDDTRTTSIAFHLAAGNINKLRSRTGLPLASYFAGTKVKWLLDNIEELQRDLANPVTRDQVAFGTVDSWLVFQLTGAEALSPNAGNVGGIFVTDVTNASRWLFMDLKSQKWDKDLVDMVCASHDLPIETALPTICPSSHVFGMCDGQCGVEALYQVPIAAILGDQQAALFGQTAFLPGEAKNTYGTGLFLMMNTGTEAVDSTHGLLTTIAYQIGTTGSVNYALEGSVSHSGSTIQWLRDQLGIIANASESETVAKTTPDNEGLYMVPAFSGLFAPYWRSDARACIVGMTASHHKGHFCRAAIEATAYQTKDIFDAITADSRVSLKTLKVDGGGTHNDLLMQFQADIIGVPVIKPVVMETTSIGAAFAAGLAVGVWEGLDELRKLWSASKFCEPKLDPITREKYCTEWQKAVTKSLGWIDVGDEDQDDETFLDARSGEETPLRPHNSFQTVVLLGAALMAGFLLGRKTSRLN
ncbi:glycerol kinase [Fistulifera solaris]|uniref:glycerol kinase n=1 Tax=Fistulifera solaris TaxID=1519565 RepID=A0A0F7R3I3_FISSO|nr:glycerol kinase [Fistulifera solaris]GAX19244.1 glycerol kinase [Fistulifera solaris]|eukprot:GAX19244.1 glycerol kinase [Fistulifera solaris]